MHAAALQLAPILGAEKSKVPFYIAGGVLVAWALIVSLGLGMRSPDFPGTSAAERGVIAITAVLVLAPSATAVITSGGEAPSRPHRQHCGRAVARRAGRRHHRRPRPPQPRPRRPPATTGTPGAALLARARRRRRRRSRSRRTPGASSATTPSSSARRPGTVTITMTNMSPVEHNVTVAQGSTVLGATPTFIGGTRTLTLNLKPGTYTFYCSVPGHRQAGMEGTLTVS